ncbi:MAG TPA: cytochrome c, partial [Blastocatellia bacterium]|nr:cytochrome c [Blastocatellia bacterium]
MKSKLYLLLTAAVLLAACLFTSSESSANSPIKKEVTFNKDVAPILFKNCAECHRPNDIAPMSLITYKEARPWARSIKEKVVTREMPPWSADPHYGEFSNDKRLSQKDIDTIVAWVDGGAKEGNPKDLPAMPEVAKGGWTIGKPDVVLQMAEEYTVDPNAPDNYVNFFIPTNFKEDGWVQAAEIMPGNRKVVHHVIA